MENCCRRERIAKQPLSSTMSTTRDVDSSFASIPNFVHEMNALTFHEREQVYDEIHGVADVIEETPEFVASSLRRMRHELANIPQGKRAALDRAVFLKPSIASDDKFHLMFLRAERFNPEKAAKKMSRYFEHKIELFGEEKLVKKITLDDLADSEMRCIRESSTQVLKVNDQGLCALYCKFSAMGRVLDWKTRTRYIWYQLMAALEDEEVQKRGVVEVANLCGTWKFGVGEFLNSIRQSQHILNDRPVRICGFHILCDHSSSLGSFISASNGLMKKDLRLRKRLHSGSLLELKYDLLSFGIRIPLDFLTPGEGIFNKDQVETYLTQRRIKEAKLREDPHLGYWGESTTVGTSDCALYPRPHDVLMGRGRFAFTWHGNLRLSELVSKSSEQHLKSNERGYDKNTVAADIVKQIQEKDGGRFLQRTLTGWEAVDECVAKHKVIMLLRAEFKNRSDPVVDSVEEEGSDGREVPAAESKAQKLDLLQGPSKRHRAQ